MARNTSILLGEYFESFINAYLSGEDSDNEDDNNEQLLILQLDQRKDYYL